MTQPNHLEHATIRRVRQPERIISLVAHRPSRYERIVKPMLDVLLAAVLLLLVAPAMALIAIAILITMGRPILYMQPRVGHRGQVFRVLKFRTMHHDRRHADRSFDGPDRRVNHKDPDDPRHTALGTFLRRSSLDELPQLINVLCGQMSLVGPRPELPSIVATHYDEWAHRRHDVKPGLTGLWQVTARQNGPMHEHVHIDLDYVDSLSITTDLRILAATLPAAMVTQRGR